MASGVEIVTFDTKVVGKGSGDQLFINTSGIGSVPPGRDLGVRAMRPGDAFLVSGELGDHGVTIMAAREELGIEAGIESDTAPLYDLVQLVAIVDETQSERASAALRQHPLGRSAARVGRVTAEHPGRVLLRTGIGAARVLERPRGELLPRVC